MDDDLEWFSIDDYADQAGEYFRDEEYLEAVEEARLGLDYCPDNDRLLGILMASLVEAGSYGEALRAYVEGFAELRSQPAALLGAVKSMCRCGRLDEARELLSFIISTPHSYEALDVYLGHLRYLRDEPLRVASFAFGVDCARMWIDANGEDPVAWISVEYWLGTCGEELERYLRAEQGKGKDTFVTELLKLAE